MRFAPTPFDFSEPPPSLAANRARRVAAMVSRIDETWRWVGKRPLSVDAAEVAEELAGWEVEAWSRLAQASGGRAGYVPSLDTRRDVVSVYEQRAANWAAENPRGSRAASEISQKMIGEPGVSAARGAAR